MRIKALVIPAKTLHRSRNGTVEDKSQQPTEIDKLLKANTTLAVWLIFFAIGGGLLALYYARIGYIPEMEWKAALVYLFIGSVTGGVVGLLLTISLYLPGVMWADFIIYDSTLDGLLTYPLDYTEHSGKESTRKEPCVRSIIIYLGLPYLVALLISHWSLRASKESGLSSVDFYWVIAVALLLVTFVVMRKIFANLTSEDESSTEDEKGSRLRKILRFLTKREKPDEKTARQIFKYSFWFTLSVLLNQISMYLIYRLSDRTPDQFDFLVLTGLCTPAVWISTHVVAVCHRSYPRQAVIASLVTAGLLLFAADSFSSLSMKLMGYYGIGPRQKFNLLVNDHGATTVASLKLKCDDSGHYLCDVQILSKVGDHYFLRVGDKKHITFPKADVVSIQRLDALELGQPVEY